jgi:hypothetical protein
VIGNRFITPGLGRDVRLFGWHRMLLLLRRQGAWPNKRPRPMPAGPGEKDVVVEFLARDSFHGPAEAGHVFAVGDAHGSVHLNSIPQQSRKIKGCTDVTRILKASNANCLVTRVGCPLCH